LLIEGLGRAYAKRLAGLGAKVAVTDLNLRSYEKFEAEAKDMTADSTVAEIEASDGTALGIEVDVRDPDALFGMVGKVYLGKSARRAMHLAHRTAYNFPLSALRMGRAEVSSSDSCRFIALIWVRV
jgi:NAD(P)-dependent dehydrogenase (short-subunit alcohol dehydrogenase family)